MPQHHNAVPVPFGDYDWNEYPHQHGSPPPATPFGDLLRQYRMAAQQTQEELAEAAGTSVRGLSNLERGVIRSPHRYTVRVLARALQLSPDDEQALQAAARRARSEPGRPAREWENPGDGSRLHLLPPLGDPAGAPGATGALLISARTARLARLCLAALAHDLAESGAERSRAR